LLLVGFGTNGAIVVATANVPRTVWVLSLAPRLLTSHRTLLAGWLLPPVQARPERTTTHGCPLEARNMTAEILDGLARWSPSERRNDATDFAK